MTQVVLPNHELMKGSFLVGLEMISLKRQVASRPSLILFEKCFCWQITFHLLFKT